MASASLSPPVGVGSSVPTGGVAGAGTAPPQPTDASTNPAAASSSSKRSLADRLRDLLHAARARWKYGPGASDVGFLSSRLVAARRAMESEDEPEPLFKDALAGPLVGARIMRVARAASAAGRPGIDAGSGGAGTGGPDTAGHRRRAPVSRIAARTLWFDGEVEAAVAGTASSAVAVSLTTAAAGPGIAVAITPITRAAPATQAVCLGAGMDTRAWRPSLQGSGRLAWFEVDADRVLGAKAAGLARVGAEGPAWKGDGGGGGGSATLTAAAGSSPAPSHSHAFPLAVRSYAALAADLGAPGWGARLVTSCGFDPASPAVFIAEGLVMYLTAGGVANLLAEAASIAAPGSVLAVVAATEAAAATARARSGGRGIMAAWTWGCPQDPTALWAAAGWRVEAVATRSDIARRWGLAWTEFPVLPAGAGRAERESLFIVAVKD